MTPGHAFEQHPPSPNDECPPLVPVEQWPFHWGRAPSGEACPYPFPEPQSPTAAAKDASSGHHRDDTGGVRPASDVNAASKTEGDDDSKNENRDWPEGVDVCQDCGHLEIRSSADVSEEIDERRCFRCGRAFGLHTYRFRTEAGALHMCCPPRLAKERWEGLAKDRCEGHTQLREYHVPYPGPQLQVADHVLCAKCGNPAGKHVPHHPVLPSSPYLLCPPLIQRARWPFGDPLEKDFPYPALRTAADGSVIHTFPPDSFVGTRPCNLPGPVFLSSHPSYRFDVVAAGIRWDAKLPKHVLRTKNGPFCQHCGNEALKHENLNCKARCPPLVELQQWPFDLSLVAYPGLAGSRLRTPSRKRARDTAPSEEQPVVAAAASSVAAAASGPSAASLPPAASPAPVHAAGGDFSSTTEERSLKRGKPDSDAAPSRCHIPRGILQASRRDFPSMACPYQLRWTCSCQFAVNFWIGDSQHGHLSALQAKSNESSHNKWRYHTKGNKDYKPCEVSERALVGRGRAVPADSTRCAKRLCVMLHRRGLMSDVLCCVVFHWRGLACFSA